ncbi:beta-galactosidase [Demequina pelophila]|uniref:beta-galactosidase n=1 Tax=Demequina pelophila TaxID=1638984 RepID=UPI0007839732|nr:beta-galactosidase [Demequina pelophila]
MTNFSWPQVDGLAYGGDYNPEQWPRETWREDVALMREAGVNLVSVGIFSWAMLEPREGEYDFSWMDELLDLLHEHGIAADLATPTVAPPAWFYANHPDARVIDKDGLVVGPGSRGMASHSHPAYQEACVRISRRLAERYADHPAVVMWHVHNEYGVPVGEDYSPAAVAAWREWLKARYGSLDGLNQAWGTMFWGQVYGEWEHVGAPAKTATTGNPAQQLDFMRFTDDQLRACFSREKAAIREFATQPVTTNFMAHQSWNCDLWKWAELVDVVADDHYLWAPDPEAHVALALSADLTRSVARGRPWILMEHSTSAVNWQGRNVAKRPGEMRRNALTHLGRGADAIMFFQWRASRSGAEKFHSAMVPHAGPRSRVFREVVELGGHLADLAPVKGSEVRAEAAVLYDWESLWAQDLEWRPSDDVQFRERMRAFYERLWRDNVTVDFALPTHDLSAYKLVVAPASYLLTKDGAENLTRYVEGGGTLLVNFFSGIVDENEAVHAGGFLAPLKDALGVTVEEFLPLREGEGASVRWARGEETLLPADVWQEDIQLHGAEVVAEHISGPGAGKPAVTRHERGAGVGWYVGTRLDVRSLAPVFEAAYADAGIVPDRLPEDLEVVTRHGDGEDFVVAVNHADAPARLPLAGTDLLTGAVADGDLEIPAGGVAVVRRPGGAIA